MVEPVFKAPVPPPNLPKEFAEQSGSPKVEPEGGATNESTEASAPSMPNTQEQSQSLEEEQVKNEKNNNQMFAQKQQILNRLNDLKEKMINYFWYSFAGLFFVGAFFGCVMSGSEQPTQQQQPKSGLSARVIRNAENKGRLAICGSSTIQTQGCIFYILNAKGYDCVAEDFFRDIAKETQRPEFIIRRANVTYAKTIIKPGYFAEIIVPSLQ